MNTEEELQNELKDMSFGPPVKRSLNAPEGYFDTFPDQVMNRWLLEKDNLHHVSRSITIRRMVATAAIVTGVCLGIALMTNQNTYASKTEDISSGDAYQYIMENIDDFAPLMLQQEKGFETNETITPDPSSIEQYLMEELEGEEIESIF